MKNKDTLKNARFPFIPLRRDNLFLLQVETSLSLKTPKGHFHQRSDDGENGGDKHVVQGRLHEILDHLVGEAILSSADKRGGHKLEHNFHQGG